ncbi:hypothetical protein A2U01_0029301, partial [Trifolium medium]|nr:hypothetical protein [Trifolium medium]
GRDVTKKLGRGGRWIEVEKRVVCLGGGMVMWMLFFAG